MTRYLLDTCAVSDARRNANPGLTAWLAEAETDVLYLSVISVGEIAWGIERLPRGKKRTTLERWLRDDVLAIFEGRIVGFTGDVAETWGRIRANAERHGNNTDAVDTMIAAIAVHHDLIVVTRNEKDFAGTSAALINPWSLPDA